MSNLYEANYQWSHRPEDERFESVSQMRDACKAYADSAIEARVPLTSLRVEVDSGDLKLIGAENVPAKMTHYAFGQLARSIHAPSAYLRMLPATLAAQNVNHGLKERAKGEGAANLLFHKNGSLVTRAITSESYDRVWNYEICHRIQSQFVENGWRVPPALPAREGQAGARLATEADILPNQKDFGLAVKAGDLIAPAGLYASDHDMFAFLVDQSEPIWDGTKFMNRGAFIQNSEVGDCSLRFKLFTYDNVCGNHIVWDVGDVTEISVRHVKGARSDGNTLRNAFAKWRVTASKLPSAKSMEEGIKTAQSKELGATKEEVLDAVFAFGRIKRLQLLNRDTLEAAYIIAENTPRYGSPRSVWGIVNGLTEHSQTSAFTDDRTALDTQAGKVMQMAF